MEKQLDLKDVKFINSLSDFFKQNGYEPSFISPLTFEMLVQKFKTYFNETGFILIPKKQLSGVLAQVKGDENPQ